VLAADSEADLAAAEADFDPDGDPDGEADLAAAEADLALAELADPVELAEWSAVSEPVTDGAGLALEPVEVLPDGDGVGVQLAVGEADGAEDELPDGLGLPPVGLPLAEPEPAPDEPEVVPTGTGPTTGFGGRLLTGGRTLVTSPTTGSGLSGSEEAPSR
jgi:hypothetical protein